MDERRKYISICCITLKKQAEKLSKSFSNENLIIDFAMRYGNPSIKSKIKN